METLAVASAGGLCTYETATGNVQKAFKQIEVPRNGVTYSRGVCLAAQLGRPLIHQYNLRKEAPTRRLVVPEKLTALRASPCGLWLAAGSASGRIYVWSLDSGALVSSCDAHFQALTTLKWTNDSTALVSGAADARVCVFTLMELLSKEQPTPQTVLTHHSLAVHDIVLGAGRFREARLFTSSQDGTIAVIDLFSGALLHTLVIGEPVKCLALDPVERAVYAGTAKGSLVINLYRVSSHTGRLESIGGQGQMVNVEDSQTLDTGDTTSLLLSPDASLLVAGDASGGAGIYSTGTFQRVRAFKKVKGEVAGLLFVDQDAEPVEFPVLQRVVESVTELTSFVPYRCAHQNTDDLVANLQTSPREELDMLDALDADAADSKPASADTSKEYEQLKKMYDDLWTRYAAVIKN